MKVRGKIVGFCAVVSGVLLFQQLAPFLLDKAFQDIPVRVTHRLNSSCTWDRKWWFKVIAPAVKGHVDYRIGDQEDQWMAFRCWRTHGLKSRQPAVKTILPHWPSKAQLGAWEGQGHEDRDALPARP